MTVRRHAQSRMAAALLRVARELVAELTPAQKRMTDGYAGRRKEGLSFGEMFKEERTYFPLDWKMPPGFLAAPPPEEVEELLDENGYFMPDYSENAVYPKDDPGMATKNPPKFTTILKKIFKDDPEECEKRIRSFRERKEGRSRRRLLANPVLSICITHNPYDVAGMSTNRDWTSCMALGGDPRPGIKEESDIYGGSHCDTALKQVQYGGMCAYLIDRDDTGIDHPYARIAIKRLESAAGDFMFRPEEHIYGDVRLGKACGFDQKVGELLDESNRQTAGRSKYFRRHDGNSYSDTEIVSEGESPTPGDLAELTPFELARTIGRQPPWTFSGYDGAGYFDELVDRMPARKLNTMVTHAIFNAIGDGLGRNEEIPGFYLRHQDKIMPDRVPEKWRDAIEEAMGK